MADLVYIYAMRESGLDEYRYVGQSVTPEIRLPSHLGEIKKPKASNPQKLRWLKIIRRESPDFSRGRDSRSATALDVVGRMK